MKRYLVFRWEERGACGGWDDFIGSASTRPAARKIATTTAASYQFKKEWHIVDSKTQEIVDGGEFTRVH